jgi:hypothetical protein
VQSVQQRLNTCLCPVLWLRLWTRLSVLLLLLPLNVRMVGDRREISRRSFYGVTIWMEAGGDRRFAVPA